MGVTKTNDTSVGCFGKFTGACSKAISALKCWGNRTVAPANVDNRVAGQQVDGERSPSTRLLEGTWVWLKFTGGLCRDNVGKFVVTFACFGLGELFAASRMMGRFAHAGFKGAFGTVLSDVTYKSLVGYWDALCGRDPSARYDIPTKAETKNMVQRAANQKPGSQKRQPGNSDASPAGGATPSPSRGRYARVNSLE